MTPKAHKRARLARIRNRAKEELARSRKYEAENRARRLLRRKQQRAMRREMALRAAVVLTDVDPKREILCKRLRELALTKRGLIEALMGIANESRDIQDQIKRIDERGLRELGLLPEQSLRKEPAHLPLKRRAA